MFKNSLYTACITPMYKSEAIDFDSLSYIARIQSDAGNGVMILGSTGECLSLRDDERRAIVAHVCELDLECEVVVGVPAYNLDVALEWLDFCNDLPICGYLMSTPIYTRPGIYGQTKWFESMLNASKHPVMLYNTPGRSGVPLHVEAVLNLVGHELFVAIKDSSGVVDSAVDYVVAAPKIKLYCGDDSLMQEFATAGAVGLISVASNIWPIATRAYLEKCLQGMGDALWVQACEALFSASNPIPCKAAMKDLGLIESDAVRMPLSVDDLPSRDTLLDYNAKIEEWRLLSTLI